MRLLLAEDEKELSRALTAVLRHNGYSVDAVYNGQDALDYLKTGIYDGAVLDIMMPKMSGLEALKLYRNEGGSTPILLLTAKSEIDDRVLGLDSGADDYLTKPFAMKELLARIRAITRRQPETTDSVLKLGNTKLNRSTFELSAGDNTIRLANKEFQMLEMLMINSGQVIPTERLMEKIWGYDSSIEINIVWVYISYLRRRLAYIGSDVHIKASRNLGYSLEVSND